MADAEITDAKELLRQVSAFGTRLKDEAARKDALWAASVEVHGKLFGGLIVDLGPGGARIRFATPVNSEEDVTLVLNQLDAIGATVVWQNADERGVEFLLAPEDVAERVRRRPEMFARKRRA
jgi:PilZ domain